MTRPAPEGAASVRERMTRWFLQGAPRRAGHPGPHVEHVERTRTWWQVMCLTGVDYFSTLGYQPAIAALAAGLVSPFATLVLVALTLFGALPVYQRVARESYRGEGSIAMLERFLPWWGGKLFVLVLLGFAATDFMITITLSAADATAHLIDNPLVHGALDGQEVLITLGLVALLGIVFLRGFREAIGIAVVLVGVYLVLNAVVVATALVHVGEHPIVVSDWWTGLTTGYGNPFLVAGFAVLVFPRLALGLSGFETGVAVMPQIANGRTGRTDAPADADGVPRARIAGTRRLLATAALIMSAFLILSSLATTLLIPQKEFAAGGEANGRALAYLAHEYLGPVFGTVYDGSTILILWFAGASAMAGLLNLVPRYLPRYGMAPQWARAVRPLVLVFTAVAFLITIVFRADVDAQGGAYATGVLVLITSASVAVTLSAWHGRRRAATIGFAVIALVFAYTTVANVVERPDGVRIAALFILAILVVSIVSRVRRSFDLRATSVVFDDQARAFVLGDAEEYDDVWLLAKEPDAGEEADYLAKLREERRSHAIPPGRPVLFIEVVLGDTSDFEEELVVEGLVRDGYRVLSVRSGNVPNTLASVLLEIRELTGVVPDVFFDWTEGNPVSNMLRYLVTGTGEVAPVTREVLRRAEPVRARRPDVHVS